MYVVGASRMGEMTKPVWCLNSKIINTTIFIDEATSNSNAGYMNLFLLFSSTPPTLKVYNNQFNTVACENI